MGVSDKHVIPVHSLHSSVPKAHFYLEESIVKFQLNFKNAIENKQKNNITMTNTKNDTKCIFSTRILYRVVSDFATDCPCGVWCRGVTTCFLYLGRLFGFLEISFKRQLVCKVDITKTYFIIAFASQ